MCGYLEARATYQLRSVSFIKSNKIQARMLTSCWNLSLKKVKIAHLDNFHVFSPIDQLWKTNFHGYVKRFKMRKESNLNLLIESTKFLISKFTVDWCSKNREEKRNPGATRRLLCSKVPSKNMMDMQLEVKSQGSFPAFHSCIHKDIINHVYL